MTPDLSAQLRPFLLGTLAVAGATGMTEATLLRQARLNIHESLTLPELQAELLTQADRSWLVSFLPLVGDRRWRITTLGHSAAQELHLA